MTISQNYSISVLMYENRTSPLIEYYKDMEFEGGQRNRPVDEVFINSKDSPRTMIAIKTPEQIRGNEGVGRPFLKAALRRAGSALDPGVSSSIDRAVGFGRKLHGTPSQRATVDSLDLFVVLPLTSGCGIPSGPTSFCKMAILQPLTRILLPLAAVGQEITLGFYCGTVDENGHFVSYARLRQVCCCCSRVLIAEALDMQFRSLLRDNG